MTPGTERPPGGGNRGAAHQIGRAGDRGTGYRTVLVDLAVELCARRRPELADDDLAEIRSRLVAAIAEVTR